MGGGGGFRGAPGGGGGVVRWTTVAMGNNGKPWTTFWVQLFGCFWQSFCLFLPDLFPLLTFIHFCYFFIHWPLSPAGSSVS